MSGLIKIIDLVEYYLYMDGERVVKADQFLHLFKTNMLEILPNVFMTDEGRLNCSPQHNFKREDLSCFFLNNFGSEIFTLIVLVMLAVLFHMMKRKTTKFIKNNRIRPWKMKLLQIFCIWPSSMINMSFLIGLIDGS